MAGQRPIPLKQQHLEGHTWPSPDGSAASLLIAWGHAERCPVVQHTPSFPAAEEPRNFSLTCAGDSCSLNEECWVTGPAAPVTFQRCLEGATKQSAGGRTPKYRKLDHLASLRPPFQRNTYTRQFPSRNGVPQVPTVLFVLPCGAIALMPRHPP